MIILGDVLNPATWANLPDQHFHCVVTSPPYWGLRDYGAEGQIGLEPTPEAFVAKMVEVFRHVRRVLRDDGVLWLNLGDSYAANRSYQVTDNKHVDVGNDLAMRVPAGLKPKDLVGVPWRVAFALQADGWYLRQDIIWQKPNPMPESVRDRCTKAHEYIFLLTKSPRYFYDAEAVKVVGVTGPGASWDTRKAMGSSGHKNDGVGWRKDVSVAYSGTLGHGAAGRNRRSVWSITTQPYGEAHFATFPEELPRLCIAAGTSERGCCPACGAPWQRVVEREALKRERPNDYTKRTGEDGTGNSCANSVAGVEVRTTGWQPACDCGGEPVPCRVLDPFGGSGTTAAVAAKMGREWTICELNPEYAKLAERRIGLATAPNTYTTADAPADAPLLAGIQEGGK